MVERKLIRQSFLKSLLGKPLAEAERAITAEGLSMWAVPAGVSAIAAVARINTVIVWQKADGTISEAEAGDPTDEVKDEDPPRFDPQQLVGHSLTEVRDQCVARGIDIRLEEHDGRPIIHTMQVWSGLGLTITDGIVTAVRDSRLIR
jgi:hypothetical protein